jgi:NapC/NirT cytochrome c family, N-terminal region
MAARLRDRLLLWLRPAVYLGHNATTLTGAVLTTSSALTLLWFWAFEILQGGPIHPYTGIVFFLILPGFFVLGLILMPVGVIWRRRKLRLAGQLPSVYPKIDLRHPVLRRAFSLAGIATVANVAIMGTATYKGVEYMDSAQFCGQTCHTVMQPEYAAYTDSPHSRVACVDCHIGPGAPWFVRSKISGVRQVFAVMFKTYSRPIPSPVYALRPARETCEQCHWPQMFQGEKLLVRTHYSDDEKNTSLTTVLLLKIGGRRLGQPTGIHGHHIDTPERINYISIDPQRQVIPVVDYTDVNGKRIEFVSTEVKTTPEQLARGEHRVMDCMDCHNRPTHAFQMPAKAVDAAISQGRISRELPFIKKKAVEVLKVSYPDRATASRQIEEAITEFYKTTYPDTYEKHRALVETAADQVRDIYLRNVFPAMNVKWGTYPNNIGHDDFLGCFRCHDGNHQSADGQVIPDDCDTCHNLLAQDESNPKILSDLGLK